MSVRCDVRSKDAKYQVGTSGFMVSQSQWSKLSCLNCIELNSSFYRIPGDSTIASLNKLPSNVNVVIKASKYITHIKRLNDVKDAWEKLWAQISKLGSRLVCVLFQLPPTFNKTDVNMGRIRAMKSYLPHDMSYAFEFRNRSWLEDSTYDIMRDLGFCVVGTYIVKRESTNWVGTMPPGLFIPPKTASFNYIRIHGKKGWKGELSERELDKIQGELSKQKTSRSYVMFNNTFFDKRSDTCSINDVSVRYAAVCNAAEFASNLATTTKLRVVDEM